MGSVVISALCLASFALVFFLSSTAASSWSSVDNPTVTNSSQKLLEPRFNRYSNIFNEEQNASLYISDPFARRTDDSETTAPANETSGRALDLEALLGEASMSGNSGDRESRIVNEKPKINIQGFIPIISVDKSHSQGHQSFAPPPPPSHGPVYNPSSSHESFESAQAQVHSNPAYGYAGPENGKQAPFGGIGAALQNLASLNPLKRKWSAPGSYQQELTPGVDCLCVPFYMCKRGFLEAATAKSSLGQINPNQFQNQQASEDFIRQQFAAAQSEASANFASVPLPSQQNNYYEPQKSNNYNPNYNSPQSQDDMNLPLDERSIDPASEQNTDQRSTYFPGNDTHETAAQYSRDSLGRMIGGSGSSCGVLRTCCRIAPEQPFQSPPPVRIGGYPSYQSHQGMESIPYPVHGNRPHGLNPYRGSPIQHHPGHGSNPPFMRPPPMRKSGYGLPPHGSMEIIGASLMKPKYPYGIQSQMGPQFAIQKPFPKQNMNFHAARPHINRAINLPFQPPHRQSIINPYPSQSLAVPSHQFQSNHLSQPSAQAGQCGARSGTSVQGRVQNLNYHESSAEFGEYPWMAALLKRIGPADSLYVCGAVLISPLWVLTAAHCIKENRAEDLKLRFGEWDVHRDDEFYPYVERFVSEIIIHPEFFQGNLMNDIALIRFDSPVEYNSPHIASACLPEPYDNLIGHRCWVTGWGKNSFGQQGEYQSVLKEVDLPIVGPNECQNALRSTRLGPFYQLHPGFMCAGGEGGKDACEGDGGSPLVCETGGVWKVAGLVSWGIGCGQPGIPGVYANVAYYRQWIDANINRYGREHASSNNNLQFLPGIIQERSNSGNETIIDREARALDSSTPSTESTTTVTSSP